jgi:hypothetical protein
MDHEVTDDLAPVVTLLRRTLDAKASEVGALAPRLPSTAPKGRRREPLVAACLVVALGASVLAGYRALAPDDRNRAVTEPPATPAPEEAGDTLPSVGVQWFLPTRVPEGFELTDLSAVPAETQPATDEQHWVIRADDGMTTVGWMTVFATPVTGGAALQPSTRSDPAVSVWGTPDFGGWTVEWVENGTLVQIQATAQIDSDTLLSLVEASTVTDGDIEIEPSAIPPELVAVPNGPATTSPTESAASVSVVLSPTVGDGGGIWVTIGPESRALDAIVEQETERRVIGGVQYSVLEGEADEYGPYTRVQWVAAGTGYDVTGRVGVDVALEVARGIEPVTSERAAAEADAITNRIHALPVVASASLSEGTTVSAHRPAGDSDGGAVGLCVAGPTTTCYRPGTESTLGGGTESILFVVVDVDGRRQVVGWMSADPTEVVPIEGLAVVDATTGVGSFLVVPVPEGGPVPDITFDLGDGVEQSYSPTEQLRPG